MIYVVVLVWVWVGVAFGAGVLSIERPETASGWVFFTLITVLGPLFLVMTLIACVGRLFALLLGGGEE